MGTARMKRRDLEHIIRAASDIADDDTIVIIGSQSILAQFPDAPSALLVSDEADVYPLHFPERSDLVDGCIGEGSPFHDTYGYYAQGVGPETAELPDGWRERAVPIRNANTRGATGLCLEVHDLLVAKAIAGREKDVRYLRDAAAHALADCATVLQRLDLTSIADDRKQAARERVLFAFAQTGGQAPASAPSGDTDR